MERERFEQGEGGDWEGGEHNQENQEDEERIFENFDDTDHDWTERLTEEEPSEGLKKREAGAYSK